jgi:hypothetical protein
LIRYIAHPTDFSPASNLAFAHALHLALDTKSKLSLLHVNEEGPDEWTSFPHVRETLVRWGLLEGMGPQEELATRLGINGPKLKFGITSQRAVYSSFFSVTGLISSSYRRTVVRGRIAG